MSARSNRVKVWRPHLVKRDGDLVDCFFCGRRLSTKAEDRARSYYASITLPTGWPKGEQPCLNDFRWMCHACGNNPNHLKVVKDDGRQKLYDEVRRLPKSRRALAVLSRHPMALHQFRKSVRIPALGVLSAFELLSTLRLDGLVEKIDNRRYSLTEKGRSVS